MAGLRIFPLGENALTIEIGNRVAPKLNDEVLKLAAYFKQNPFSGFVESVPAYASLTIFFDVKIVRRNFKEFPTAFDAVKNLAENALLGASELEKRNARLIEIPACFDAESAPDLDFVASSKKLSPGEVIEIFLGKIYRVYMLGFLPGFAYMGELDRRIAAPRKQSPRAFVPKGSIGIAGRQTGIYSLASPGGWQIIGKIDCELFTPEAVSPTLLRAGDTVKFYKIKPAG